MSVLRRLEREMDARLRKLFAAPTVDAQGKELIEIERGVLEEVTGKVRSLRRGKRVFPWNHLTILVPVPEPDRREVFAVALDGAALVAEIGEALRETGCEPPADLSVDLRLLEQDLPEAVPRGFHISYQNRAPEPVAGVAPSQGALCVLQGRAAQERLALGTGRINIGRLAEIVDDQQRLIRRNDLVFLEGDEIAATVSRSHAHIRFDAPSGEYRLFDDQSAYGTTIFREGALVHVPSGAGRGMGLRPGDEISFGRARVRFDIG